MVSERELETTISALFDFAPSLHIFTVEVIGNHQPDLLDIAIAVGSRLK